MNRFRFPVGGRRRRVMVPFLVAGAGARCPAFSRHTEEWCTGRSWPDSSQGFALRGMVPSPTPKRDHGDPQSLGFEARAKVKLVRAEGLEPSRALRPNGYARLRLSPPLLSC